MRQTNILSIICIFITMISCSMNEDILDNGTSSVNPDATSAYVSFYVTLNGSTTKSTIGESSKPEDYPADAITNCALFLLDATNKVVGLSTVSNGDTPKPEQVIKVLTKIDLATRVIAVVNYNSSNSKSILNCGTYDEIKAYRESDPTYRMKVGEIDIDWANVDDNADVPNINVEIKVSSVTAVVELDQFQVTYTGAGDGPEVKLTEVCLVNLKSEAGLYNEGDNVNTEYLKINEKVVVPAANLAIRKNVYPNTNETSPIKMRIKFTVGGAEVDAYGNPYVREYIVNRPTVDGEYENQSGHNYVKAGYWYVLNVGVKVHTGKVDCSIDCVVRDWDYKKVDLGDISGIKK